MATIPLAQLDELRKQPGLPHDSRMASILAVEIPIALLMLGVVGLRFYARACIKKALGADDWVMAAATFFAIVGTIMNCVATRYGAGIHLWDVDLSGFPTGPKLGYAYAVLFTPSVVLCKISICITYVRIFPSRIDRAFSKGCIWLLIILGTACTIALLLPCIPIEKYWATDPMPGKCYDIKLAFIITSSMNTVTDFAVFLWPAPRLWTVRIPVKQRLELILVFSIGCLICAAGVGRIYYIAEHYYSSPDVTYNIAILYILSAVECNLAILCGSLPQVRPLLSRKRGNSSARTRSGGQVCHFPDMEHGVVTGQRQHPSNRSVIVYSETQSKAGLEQMSINIMLDDNIWRQNIDSRPQSANRSIRKSQDTQGPKS